MSRRHRKGRPVHGILLLDKPPGGSSNHALQRVKRLFGARKAGHTGTLDPLATGMLPLCLGEATKLSAHLIDADKGYETTLRLGITTDSADADGTPLEERPVPPSLDAAAFAAHCAAFVGPQLQVPPMVSAIKVDGKRLYALAREGVTIERAPRPVTIRSLEVLAFDGTTARLAVRCSKGTYIRSLVTDIGERIGCGAHVTALRRTFVAPFGPEHALVGLDALERLVAGAGPGEAAHAALDALLLPPDAGLGHLPEAFVDEAGAGRFRAGQDAPVIDSPQKRVGAEDERVGADGPGAPTASGEGGAGVGAPGSVTRGGDAAPDATDVRETTWRVREADGRLVGLGVLSADGTRVAPSRVLQWD